MKVTTTFSGASDAGRSASGLSHCGVMSVPDLQQTSPRESTLRAADGTHLFVLDWPAPVGQPTCGGVVLMHGLGEHCGRYAHVAQFFNQLGWTVRAYDQRGHGRSSGPRGDVPADGTLLDDAAQVLADFSSTHADLWVTPPLLFGHSMGGLFAARFATSARLPLRGLILSSPLLVLRLTPFQSMLAAVMRRLAPGFAVSNGLKAAYLSHDLALVAAYRIDPYGQGKISARLLRAIRAAIEQVQRDAASLRLPVLMVVAGDDRLVDASGSEQFYARSDPARVVMHRYPQMYHEIFNEIDKDQVFDDLRVWLTQPGR